MFGFLILQSASLGEKKNKGNLKGMCYQKSNRCNFVHFMICESVTVLFNTD